MGKAPETPANQTVTNKTELPEWVTDAGKANLGDATNVANNLASPYTGNLVSGLNGDHSSAFDMVRNFAQSAQPSLNTAQNTLNSVQGYGGSNINAGNFGSANLSSYMNPYTSNVIDAAKSANADALKQGLNQIGDSATSAGAFGGSRHGVAEGVAQAQSAQNMASLTAQLQGQNFSQAQAAIAADQNRALTADQSNQSNSLEAQRLRAAAASQGATTASQIQQSGLQGASSMQAVADAQRQYQQDLLNQQYDQYTAQKYYPIEQLNIKQNALGVTPYGQTSTTTGPSNQQAANPLMGALGGLSAGASIASSLLPAAGAAGTAAGGGAGALLGLLALSDKNTKKDIQPLGKDPITGTPVSAFRYKGDPANSPKVIGPMAQDMEEHVPGSVVTAADGTKLVDSRASEQIKINFLTGGKTPKGKGKNPAKGLGLTPTSQPNVTPPKVTGSLKPKGMKPNGLKGPKL